jgi:hypothetical protein
VLGAGELLRERRARNPPFDDAEDPLDSARDQRSVPRRARSGRSTSLREAAGIRLRTPQVMALAPLAADALAA